jgi:2-deoxy-D-gluconate 3-dehydrogenase
LKSDLFDLTGKRALVTGAGRGIGRAVAVGLARAGARVALVARTAAQLEEVSREISEAGGHAVYRATDLSAVEEHAELVSGLVQDLGGLDILVNNAGLNMPQPTLEVTPAAWDRVIGLNLRGAFFLAQAAARRMVEASQGGRIINVSSQCGSVALIKRAAYCASKAGLDMVTKVMAVELAPHGILVNAVAPTFIETELTRGMLADPEFRQYAMSKNLLKRFGTPDDVLGAVLYLASSASNLVTGHVLLVDAGWTAH